MDVLNGETVYGKFWSSDTPSVPLGYKAWTFSPRLCASASLAVSGTQYVVAIDVPAAMTITNLYWGVAVAGTTPTAGQNWAGLYDPSGNLLGSLGIDSDITSIGRKTAAVGTINLSAGFVYASLIFNAATPPQVPRCGGSGGATMINGSLTGANLLFATNGTGKTSMPSSITMSSNIGGQGYWAAVA